MASVAGKTGDLADAGVSECLFNAINGEPDLEYAMIDGPVVQAHHKQAHQKQVHHKAPGADRLPHNRDEPGMYPEGDVLIGLGPMGPIPTAIHWCVGLLSNPASVGRIRRPSATIPWERRCWRRRRSVSRLRDSVE